MDKFIIASSLLMCVYAHTPKICWEYGNGILTIYGGTYHSLGEINNNGVGGVILDNTRYDFTSIVSKNDFNLLEISNCWTCPTYKSNGIKFYQTVQIPINSGSYSVSFSKDTVVEWPWCSFPDIEVVDDCDNSEDPCLLDEEQAYIPTGPFAKKCNCTHYYQCGNQGRVENACPEGTVFNPVTNYCDYPENVPECSETTLCTPEQYNLGTAFPNPEDCHSFHRCVNEDNKPNYLETLPCEDGLVFDPELLYCNDPKLVSGECGTNEVGPCDDLPISNIPYKINCTHYLKCGNGNAYLIGECPSGTYFNDNMGYCDWPHNVLDCSNLN